MPPKLPANWLTLSVATDLGIRGSFPRNLRIKRQANTKNLYSQWLPSLDDDTRSNHGRGKNGKRLTLSQSMGTDDPYEAGKRAIAWVERKQTELREQSYKVTINAPQEYLLIFYWERWFARESLSRKNNRNFNRWQRETKLKWGGQGYGICHQPWAKKNVDQINFLDFSNYFALLDSRKTLTNDMSETKAQQKTLIKKLMRESRTEFKSLIIPDFPTISKQDKEAPWLNYQQWDQLIGKIVDLTGGVARQSITREEYSDLQWSKNRLNVRNWVDLYDAILLQWFFYLRPLDMPRLQSEFFKDEGSKITCNLKITKGNRAIYKTEHYRDDAYSFWQRMVLRRPTGYLILPHLNRPPGNENDSHCLETLNFLLVNALMMCDPPIRVENVSWVTIRHTALYLTLKDYPEFGVIPGIYSLARNARTSDTMLTKRYLKHIEAEDTAIEARKQIKPGKFTLVKRVLP